jgi:membrane associated rhomboid family serine protease
VHVSDGQTGSGWSEQYAETGGWPPPAAGQSPYGPGTTPPADDPAGGPDDGAGPDGGRTTSWAPGAAAGSTATGRSRQPADPTGTGSYGAPGQTGTGGYGAGGQTGTGGYGPAGQWIQPADQTGTGAYGTGDQTGTGGFGAAGQTGTGGYGSAGQWGQQPGSSWAPGDSAYGRLTGGTPQPAPQQPPQRPRRPWDGRPAPVRRPGRTPVVTYTLIGICLFVYLLQQADPGFTGRYGLIPFAVEQGQYARLLTAAFLHAGLLHLATNMITLYIVGAPLERVLRPARYLTVYVLSALGGSLLSVWLSPEFSVGVGASGAIFGLFGALVVLRRQVGAEAGGLAVLIGLNLVISFTVPNISWQAHIGGLITGALVALAMTGVDRLTRRPAG